MTILLGGLWIVVISALALLTTMLAAGLEMDCLHLLVSGDVMCTDPAMLAAYPVGTLRDTFTAIRPLDLAIFAACLLVPGGLTLRHRLHQRWTLMIATVALAAAIPWNLLREYAPPCETPLEVNRLQYLFPAILATMLALHFGRVWAERAR